MNKPGLYIHIPFCRSKCPYCDFYSIISQEEDIEKFILSLIKEMSFYKNVELCREFGTIYIGGGSPGILSAKQFFRLVENLNKTFTFSSVSEFTIELNPEDVSKEKVMILKSAGVNRISLGVQSFDERDLKFLGRRHSINLIKNVISIIKSAGFILNVDLIYGLFCQTENTWLKVLNDALSFEPEHISAYQLTIKENTPFGKMMNEKKIKESSEKKQADLFLKTSDFLEEKGYVHYEVSNFARNKKYFCRHNMKYWERIPYLGLGPSAHSFFNEERWSNYSSFEKYCKECGADRLPIEKKEKLTEQQAKIEKIYLGFRTQNGVPEKYLNGENAEKIIKQLQKQELINRVNHKIISTKKGFLVSGGLPIYFI
ncbi:MAG: radical SAM family heme chaperone HemW [Candidatus Omnitrophica bacterium]|nr:radical SAM family heme chaperone HemW [Candidatus Omnitrophota bacterium]